MFPIADATTSSLKHKAVCSGHRVRIPTASTHACLPQNHRHDPCSPYPSSDSERRPSTADVLCRQQLRADSIRRSNLNGSTASELGHVLGLLLQLPASAAYLGLGRAVFNSCSTRSLCQYIVKYGDGSNTTGTYTSDVQTVTPDFMVRGFRFGCSHAITELLSAMQVDMLLALGDDVPSLVMQTAEKAFSYCLPPTESHSGFLTRGVPHHSSSRFTVTPMHGVSGVKTCYGVLLQGIAVARRRLDIPSSVFSTGSVLDSGTVITELPLTAHRALRAAFRQEMKMYPRAAPANGFDTCFNLTGVGGDVKLPSVALVFDRGATVELDSSGIIYDVCLAFFTTGDDTSASI